MGAGDETSSGDTPRLATWRSLLRLDRWLDGMRQARGYGGPVVHWWRDCLLFCGPGLDWRYEGILAGYVTLFEHTGQQRWLQKAVRAADDVAKGQLPDGRYRDSRFEANPGPGGTPHEAAVDIGLLSLARALRAAGDARWRTYLAIVERNVSEFHLGRLWDRAQGRYRDGPRSFVPNKAATFVEMLCLLSELTGSQDYVPYIDATAKEIRLHQVRDRASPVFGGIAQAAIRGRRIEKFFPFYVARCIPGLLAAYVAMNDARSYDAATAAAEFVGRWVDDDGGLPQVIYGGGAVNRYPRWVAGAGDVVRAFVVARSFGIEVNCEPTLRWMLTGQLQTGAFKSADGFGLQVTQRQRPGGPDARDLIPVVGWNDKAFRALAIVATNRTGTSGNNVGVRPDLTIPEAEDSGDRKVELPCRWHGRAASYREDDQRIEVVSDASTWFRWHKSDVWADLRARRSDLRA
jgi:hypothetical protein